MALVCYQLATLAASQRWVAPVLTDVVFLALFYATDAGAAVPAYGVTGLILLPLVAWLTRQQLSVEETAAREVTAAAGGGLPAAHLGALVSAGVAAVPLVVVAVGWAYLANHGQTHSAAQLGGGIAIHAMFALAGVGLGALCSRPLVTAPGKAVLVIAAVVVVGLIVHVSPLFLAVRALETDPAHHFCRQTVPPLVTLAVLGIVGCAISTRAAARE